MKRGKMTISNAAIEIPGYNVIRNDRNRKGGGVAIYVRKNISFIERNELNTSNLEITWDEISKPKSNLVSLQLGNEYRPPNSKLELFDEFERFLQHSGSENKELIITGDLNCNFLQANSNPSLTKLKRSHGYLPTTKPH